MATVHEISLKLAHAPARIFGLGERYNALDQAGNRVDQFVYNQYKNQGLRTYIPMPVFYTDQSLGCISRPTPIPGSTSVTPGRRCSESKRVELLIDPFTGSVNEQVAQFMASTGEPANVPSGRSGRG